MIAKLGMLLLIPLSAAALVGCEVEVKDPGALPDIDVEVQEEGRLPEIEVRSLDEEANRDEPADAETPQ